MKHNKGIVLFVLLVGVIILSSMINTPEKATLHYFKNHREALEDDTLNFIKTGQIPNHSHVSVNYWDGKHPILEWIVVSSGIVPASKYYGIFYSFDDKPVSFQNSNEPLNPVSEQEWEWNGEGDNRGFIRRLDTNWFYFEAAL